MCSVVLEECEDVIPDRQSADAGAGENVTFTLTTKNGCMLSGTDYEDAVWRESGNKTILTLYNIRYPTVVKLETAYDRRIYYANGGTGSDICEPYLENVKNTRIETFTREGYIQTGWNTKADGTGEHIGLGSRTDSRALYAEWEKETPAEEFLYENTGNEISITGYTGQKDCCVIPEWIEGKRVCTIGSGAFCDRSFKKFVCSSNVRIMEPQAFRNVTIEQLTISDDMTQISDQDFVECRIKTLRLNARRKPVYAGSYFSAFPDKCERLFSLQGKKIVLFSGSSARYGYHSKEIEQAFPDYQIVNMGTYAYTNALPQLDIIAAAMKEGDILLEAPEFDAAGQQFCESNALDRFFFALVEEDYGLLEYLDLTQYTEVFDALGEYFYEHGKLEEKDYSYLASDYDDDGNRVDYPTYNEYGDYTLIRPDSERDEMHRIIPAEYTTDNITPERIDTLDRALAGFKEKGVTVWFTYAPRNRSSLSRKSTEKEMQKLEALLQEELEIPVISRMKDYFYSGIYFYEIDNHLSDHGAELRTEQIIKDMKDWIEKNE